MGHHQACEYLGPWEGDSKISKYLGSKDGGAGGLDQEWE